MLAALLNVPNDEAQWSRWSFNNLDAVSQIRDAIQAQKNVRLPSYDIEPIDFNDLDGWLANNQQAHLDFNSALGLQSNDLEHTDLRDQKQKESFIWLNYMELQQASNVLKIGP